MFRRTGPSARLGLSASATLALGVLALATPRAAQPLRAQNTAAVTVDPTATYTLTARNSDKALDVRGSSTADGAVVDQWALAAGVKNQQWKFTSVGTGYYRLTSVNSGKVLDVDGVSTADGAKIQQWSITNGDNQAWSLKDAGSGYVNLVAKHSGKALDVTGASTANGTALDQWPLNGGANQAWLLAKVTSPTGGSSTPTPTTSTGGGSSDPGGTSDGSTVGTVTGSAPSSYPGAGIVSGDTQVHDPSMAKGPDGTYILMGTAPGLSIRTSSDRTNFVYRGVAFPGGTSWTDQYTHAPNANLWAPDISYHHGQYYLYYAASSFGSNTSAIFLATSKTGMPGSWSNQGKIIETHSSNDYNAIDPNLSVGADGRWTLSLGSFWNGIRQIQLDPNTGKRSGSSITTIASRPGSTAEEAPFIFRHGNYYFLFLSFDNCCKGVNSTYKIMVGRGTSVSGPFYDKSGNSMMNGAGTQLFATHGRWIGPGGQSVMADSDSDLLVYHYYDGQDNGTAKLGLNLLGWDSSDWPYVH